MVNKKAQGSVFGMSFGTIFSIFLIIFFLVIAFIVINKFLEVKKCSQIGLFLDSLDKKVDRVWKSDRLIIPFSKKNEVVLPNDIKKVCFIDPNEDLDCNHNDKVCKSLSEFKKDNKNLYFYPPEKSCKMFYYNLKHINLNKILNGNKIRCFDVNDGKISLKIGPTEDNLVIINKNV